MELDELLIKLQQIIELYQVDFDLIDELDEIDLYEVEVDELDELETQVEIELDEQVKLFGEMYMQNDEGQITNELMQQLIDEIDEEVFKNFLIDEDLELPELLKYFINKTTKCRNTGSRSNS